MKYFRILTKGKISGAECRNTFYNFLASVNYNVKLNLRNSNWLLKFRLSEKRKLSLAATISREISLVSSPSSGNGVSEAVTDHFTCRSSCVVFLEEMEKSRPKTHRFAFNRKGKRQYRRLMKWKEKCLMNNFCTIPRMNPLPDLASLTIWKQKKNNCQKKRIKHVKCRIRRKNLKK